MNYQPNYAEHFSCLASACPDTCCAGWEIIVDKQSESYYKTLGGSLGDAVRQAMTTDEDGDTVFIQRNKRCPFLNEQNLCDLRTAIGWEHTSEICREHPRFTEEYDGFTEHSLSLSCPAVGKLIFSSPVASCYPPIQTKSTDEALNILASTRNELFTQLDESKTVTENIKLLFERSLSAQNQIAEIESEARFWDKIVYPNEDDLITFCSVLLNECEILTDEWKQLLTKSQNRISFADTASFIAENNTSVNRALAYFVYRYFLKSVNHLDCRATARFIVLSTFAPIFIAYQTKGPLEGIYRLYSKEIEHDTVNLDLLFDFTLWED